MDQEKIILGIDPGTMVMGYGVIREQGKKMELITMGVINLKKLANQALKLKKIFERVLEIINEYHPDELAIEAPFFGKNVQSMLKLGRAQGIVIAASLHAGMEVYEYSPRKIKQSITGNGNASKEQVSAMLCRMYPISEHIQFLDATDALAVAVCHHLQQKVVFGKTKATNWKSFIAQNAERVVK